MKKKLLFIVIPAFFINSSYAKRECIQTSEMAHCYDITDIKDSPAKKDLPPCDKDIHRQVTVKNHVEYFEPCSSIGQVRTGLYTYYYGYRNRGQRPLGSFQRYVELTAREIHPYQYRRYILKTFGC